MELKKIDIYSKKENKVVSWDVKSEEETDEGGNVHNVITARYKDEVLKFSPNTTDKELLNQAEIMNKEK